MLEYTRIFSYQTWLMGKTSWTDIGMYEQP
jgi:hypothetical protein